MDSVKWLEEVTRAAEKYAAKVYPVSEELFKDKSTYFSRLDKSLVCLIERFTWKVRSLITQQNLRVWHEKDGYNHGEYRVWHKNGQLMVQFTFVNGLIAGKYTRWDEEGIVQVVCSYEPSGLQ